MKLNPKFLTHETKGEHMIAYNVASAFEFFTEMNKPKSTNTKLEYKVNFSVVFSFVLQFMTNNAIIESHKHLMNMLTRNMTHVRSGIMSLS